MATPRRLSRCWPKSCALRALLVAGLATAFGLAGCATLPEGNKPTPGDPFERMNRSIWTFDNAFDHAILRPVAQGYVNVTPTPVRRSIRNFMTNLAYSDTIVNDLLQAKFNDFANDCARLVVNTLIGVGGLFDPASHMDLDRHNTDVGQTLGIWGVHRGPFLMLPFLGPSDLRDAFGRSADEYLTPRAYIQNPYARWSLFLVDEVDVRSHLLDGDRVIDNAYDSYVFVRNAYLQSREFKIHGDNQTETPQMEFPDLDPGATPGASPGAAPGAAPGAGPDKGTAGDRASPPAPPAAAPSAVPNAPPPGAATPKGAPAPQ